MKLNNMYIVSECSCKKNKTKSVRILKPKVFRTADEAMEEFDSRVKHLIEDYGYRKIYDPENTPVCCKLQSSIGTRLIRITHNTFED